jgi:hypothetical protein
MEMEEHRAQAQQQQVVDYVEKGGVRMQVLVDGVARTVYSSGQASSLICPAEGKSFVVTAKNTTERPFLVLLLIDGVVANPGSYLVEPKATVTFHGWQKNDREAEAFVFQKTTAPQGEGELKTSMHDVGLIEAQVFSCDVADKLTRVQSPVAPVINKPTAVELDNPKKVDATVGKGAAVHAPTQTVSGITRHGVLYVLEMRYNMIGEGTLQRARDLQADNYEEDEGSSEA